MYPALSSGSIGVELPFEESARLAYEVGFRGVSVDLRRAMDDVDATRCTLERNKLAPASWGLPVQFRTDEEEFLDGLSALAKMAKVARSIGSSRCTTWINSFSDMLLFRENFNLHVARLKACAEVLAENDCRLGIEFVGPKTFRDGHKYEFIHTLDETLDLCEAIGTGNIGLVLDAFHWHTSHATKEDIHRLSDALVVDVHINDGVEGRSPDEQLDRERRLPGTTGVIDLTSFLQGLKAIGYSGPVTPETFDTPELAGLSPEDAIRKTAESLLTVWKRAEV